MFLLVSVRHVRAHPGKHQRGVSIQISISLGKTFLRISRIRNIPLTWILAKVFVYVPPFISQILDFIYWTALIWFWSILNGVTLKTNNRLINKRLNAAFSPLLIVQPTSNVSFWSQTTSFRYKNSIGIRISYQGIIHSCTWKWKNSSSNWINSL